jgi:hypothetical protein
MAVMKHATFNKRFNSKLEFAPVFKDGTEVTTVTGTDPLIFCLEPDTCQHFFASGLGYYYYFFACAMALYMKGEKV